MEETESTLAGAHDMRDLTLEKVGALAFLQAKARNISSAAASAQHFEVMVRGFVVKSPPFQSAIVPAFAGQLKTLGPQEPRALP